jgi:GTP cyclohydrolase I
MIPNFHDTSLLDLLMMFVYSLPAIIAAIAALLAAKGTAKNRESLARTDQRVEAVHELVNGNFKAIQNEKEALKTEVGQLKAGTQGGSKP